MNTKTKRRLTVVTGIIIVVLILVLALVGGANAAQSITVAQAADGSYVGQRVQVSGSVVDNSFETVDNVLTFSIYDPDEGTSVQLKVSYEGGVSATFGNGVTAICTGTIDEDGTLVATELVTQCPSKYESATDALSVSSLLEYGDTVYDKTLKVTGIVKEGTLTAAGTGERLVLLDADTGDELSIAYDGALSDEITDGSVLVIAGSLGSDLTFNATDVALEG